MIGLAVALAILGMLLSAFFSGTETGFYRAARVRLVLDALGGDRIARALVWLANRPSIFIATTLAGTNLANDLVSLAIVMATQAVFTTQNRAAELLIPLILAPVLFVYGELLPKNLFLHSPNRLLRKTGPLFLLFVVLFLPVSLLLWGFNKLLERLLASPPERVRLMLARRELRRVLDEGHEVGLLRPAQQALAQGILAVASRPIGAYAVPLAAIPRARAEMTKDEILGLARRYRISDVCVEEAGPERRPAGYVRVIDLALEPSERVGPLRPLLKFQPTDTYLDTLMRMQAAKEELAQIVDADGQTIGVLTIQRLREPLFHGTGH